MCFTCLPHHLTTQTLINTKALMRKCDGCLDIYANLMDANVYLLAGWVIELIKHKDFTR